MSPIAPLRTQGPPSVQGAALMVVAGMAFAVVNTLTPILTWQMGLSSTTVILWQYGIATLAALPLLRSLGLGALRTRHLPAHLLRTFVSALGVQAFVLGFAQGVPVWQMVALSMTSPFFVIAGATLFLGETLTARRLLASMAGFAGALMVAEVGSEGFTAASLLPAFAAACWASASLLTKWLSRTEAPESLTVWMLALIMPNHLLIGLALSLATGAAAGFDLALPRGAALGLILALGLVTALAQHALSLAYRVADATFLQPFDDLKLPLNVLLGWIVLGQVPAALFWPGALLIVAASMQLLWRDPGRAMPAEA